MLFGHSKEVLIGCNKLSVLFPSTGVMAWLFLCFLDFGGFVAIRSSPVGLGKSFILTPRGSLLPILSEIVKRVLVSERGRLLPVFGGSDIGLEGGGGSRNSFI